AVAAEPFEHLLELLGIAARALALHLAPAAADPVHHPPELVPVHRAVAAEALEHLLELLRVEAAVAAHPLHHLLHLLGIEAAQPGPRSTLALALLKLLEEIAIDAAAAQVHAGVFSFLLELLRYLHE